MAYCLFSEEAVWVAATHCSYMLISTYQTRLKSLFRYYHWGKL